MKRKNIDIVRIVLACVGIGILTMVMVLIITLHNNPEFTIQEINKHIPYIFFYVLICSLIIIVTTVISFVLFKFLDSDVLKTTLKRVSKNISYRMATKNSKYIYNCLQVFLCDVIKRNNETLKLSVSDVSSLTPKGYTVSCRNNCVFYRFEIVTPPRRLEYDCDTYKSILNGFIGKELYCYGIQGLEPSFQNTPSVFIDRLFYNSNTLTIDILFIDNQTSYLYFQKAVERDRKLLKNEEVVKRLLRLLSNR